jgi:rhodanese-related sulfurtransferase
MARRLNMTPQGRMDKKNIVQMSLILLAGLAFGLGSNLVSRRPLPLFKALAKPAPAGAEVRFTEVDADFVAQLGGAPDTLLLDARFPELFALGHIPGAVSLPLSRFDEAFAEREPALRAARLLVLYCSGPDCHDSRDLALRLREKGFRDLLLYRGGIEDWQEKGHALGR